MRYSQNVWVQRNYIDTTSECKSEMMIGAFRRKQIWDIFPHFLCVDSPNDTTWINEWRWCTESTWTSAQYILLWCNHSNLSARVRRIIHNVCRYISKCNDQRFRSIQKFLEFSKICFGKSRNKNFLRSNWLQFQAISPPPGWIISCIRFAHCNEPVKQAPITQAHVFSCCFCSPSHVFKYLVLLYPAQAEGERCYRKGNIESIQKFPREQSKIQFVFSTGGNAEWWCSKEREDEVFFLSRFLLISFVVFRFLALVKCCWEYWISSIVHPLSVCLNTFLFSVFSFVLSFLCLLFSLSRFSPLCFSFFPSALRFLNQGLLQLPIRQQIVLSSVWSLQGLFGLCASAFFSLDFPPLSRSDRCMAFFRCKPCQRTITTIITAAARSWRCTIAGERHDCRVPPRWVDPFFKRSSLILCLTTRNIFSLEQELALQSSGRHCSFVASLIDRVDSFFLIAFISSLN